MSDPATTSGTNIVACPHCGTRNRVKASATGTPRCGSCRGQLPWVVEAGESEFGAQIGASVPVLVDFWAPWCGPCRQISPALERMANRYAGRLKLVKVNVDEHNALAARYGAMSIPLLVLFENGQEVGRKVGAVPEAQLATWIESRLADQT